MNYKRGIWGYNNVMCRKKKKAKERKNEKNERHFISMNDGTVTMGGKKKKRRSVEISLLRYNTNEWTLFGKNESLRALMAGASASAREFFPSVNWPPAVGSCLLLTFILIYCLYEPWQTHTALCHITHEEYKKKKKKKWVLDNISARFDPFGHSSGRFSSSCALSPIFFPFPDEHQSGASL